MNAFGEWADKKLAGGIERIPDEKLLAAFEWTNRHGSGNSWAGTAGEAATIIRELLLEIARLKA